MADQGLSNEQIAIYAGGAAVAAVVIGGILYFLTVPPPTTKTETPAPAPAPAPTPAPTPAPAPAPPAPITTSLTVSLSPGSPTTQQRITASGKLDTSDGAPLSGATVALTLDGTWLASPQTASDGTWAYTFGPEAPGSHTLEAKYSGSPQYAAAAGAVNFKVPSAAPTTPTLTPLVGTDLQVVNDAWQYFLTQWPQVPPAATSIRPCAVVTYSRKNVGYVQEEVDVTLSGLLGISAVTWGYSFAHDVLIAYDYTGDWHAQVDTEIANMKANVANFAKKGSC